MKHAPSAKHGLKFGLALAALAVFGSGCTLTQLTPQARFQDSAYTLNDAARWNNVDVAMRYVAPAYTQSFAARHSHWGGGISIGEYDLTRLTMAPDKETAVSEVVITWYDQGGVRVHTSTITQRWEKTSQVYLLAGESIRVGDSSVFAAEEQASGGPQ